jgi:signal transduction histidine kinase
MTPSALANLLPGRAVLRRDVPPPVLLVLFGAVVIPVYLLLPGDAQSVLYVVIGLIAVGAMLAGAFMRPAGRRLPWFLFAAGFLCEIGGDITFTVYELGFDREPPTPSIADALYLSGYPLLVLGLVLLVRRLGGLTSRVALLDMAIVFVAVATVQWVFFVGPYIDEPHAASERLVGIAYPCMEVILLVGFAQLLVGPARRSATYWLLVASATLWIAADEIYGLSTGSYEGGAWIDALWLGSYVLWGAAGLHSRHAAPVRAGVALPRFTSARAVLLGAALVAAPATAVVERALGHHVHVGAEALGATVIAVLVLVRLSGLLKAVDRARDDEREARVAAESMHRQLAAQNDRLRELDRLKDEFVASVSHELRTPLTSISGYAELLLEEGLDDAHRGYVAVVERNAHRLLELVNDLLLAARLQAGGVDLRKQPFDLHAVVQESLESVARQAEAGGVELRLDAGEPLPSVDGDAARVAQVVTNLLSNAIKFTPSGGRVDLTLAARDGVVSFRVADTGIGIPEDELERLFERFFRSQTALERHIPGTGLGLYITKAIVEAHGGRISVESAAGEGTAFLVELPAAVRSTPPAELAETRA